MNSFMQPQNLVFVWLSIGSIALFSFVTILGWSDHRRREKEAFYKNETIKKISESTDGAASVLEYLREEKLQAEKKRREKIRLGGLITAAAGLGLMIFLFASNHADHDPDPIYLVGLIPLLIGAAMLAYTYWLAPKESAPQQ
jgi:hypothetical protein